MLFSVTMRYTLNDLRQEFSDEEACLKWLINWQNPDGIICKKCEKITKHYKLKNRKAYSCGTCGSHIYPMARTIFHKTTTPLIYWIYCMFLITNTRGGIPAKQIERELGITYKTAWRMMHKIRELMVSDESKFKGKVEIDETFIHGNVYKRSSAKKKYGNTGARRGQIVFGMIERNGRARMFHVPSTGVRILIPKIESNIAFGSTVYSDSYSGYKTLNKRGYTHYMTNHSKFEWADGENSVQNIESLWSRFKMGIKAVFRFVSDKHLQKYCNEFAWRHSYRNNPSMFWSLMCRI